MSGASKKTPSGIVLDTCVLKSSVESEYRAVGDDQKCLRYHQGETNPQVVADALEGSGIRVRVLALP